MTQSRLFLLLVLLQACHSIEEFTFGLYKWLGPFKALERAIPGSSPIVFAILNVGFLMLGLWGYFGAVRPGRPAAGAWIGIWCAVEIFNGIGHPVWSLLAGAYVPGTGTAPLLLVTALALLRARRRDHRLRDNETRLR